MDSSEDWEWKKDAELFFVSARTIKRHHHQKGPACTCFGVLQLHAGETGLDHDPVQLHGRVRGSISNVDRTESLSFLSTLKALCITLRINLEKIRKVVMKRTFEAHDLMLRNYHAVKFSSSSQWIQLSGPISRLHL
jgi:hypothetical protein